MTRASFVRPGATQISFHKQQRSIGCCHPMLLACTLPRVVVTFDPYWIGGTEPMQAAAVIPAAVGGFGERTTASSNEQNDFTPVELKAAGLVAISYCVFTPALATMA